MEIREAKKKHEAPLMAIPEVVSVGIGLGLSGKPTILVGISKEKTSTPIPSTLEGHPVEVFRAGSIEAQ